MTGRAAKIVPGAAPKGARIVETGSPLRGSPPTPLSRSFDIDAGAVVTRHLYLRGCKAPPKADGFATSDARPGEYLLDEPQVPPVIDVSNEPARPILAVELTIELGCTEPWAKWIALPLDDALRDGRVGVTASSFVVGPEAPYLLAPEIARAAKDWVDAGKKFGLIWGASSTGFAPTPVAIVPFRVRVAESDAAECETSTKIDGTVVRYHRVIEGSRNRRFAVALTDRPLLVVDGAGDMPRTNPTEVVMAMPPDKTCGTDLTPKLAATAASAMALGVPRALLEEEGAVDFHKEAVIVFGPPTTLERLSPGQGPEVNFDLVPAARDCPGGRPPRDPDDESSSRSSPAAKRPAIAEVDAASVARAYVIAKGTALPTRRLLGQGPRPCTPRP